MPSEPTVEEVENLLDDIQHWGSIDDSRIPLKTRTMLVALCRHFLAPAAAPQLSAGEFAGLVVADIRDRAEWFRKRITEAVSLEDVAILALGLHRWEVVLRVLEDKSRTHNIEIVEPKK